MDLSITQALDRWREGDEQAALQLDRCLRTELIALVRSRRNQRYRARIDSEGVVNAALKSFLSGVRKDEFKELKDQQGVRKLLACFVIRVLRDEIRAAQADKRDVRNEVVIADDHAKQLADIASESSDECARSVEFMEKFTDLVRGIHEKAIEILELRLEGLTTRQIAAEVGLSTRYVQKITENMIKIGTEWIESDGESPRC